ncbi:hypothetical protein J25TS5_04160 [Paenibacillus faecis]|uniref:hypothetical protein n=1 Tax=Paenibacillus faecis TaxID=862114 RepID=UPI001B28A3B8|nr:hypothetical protein [Paenibacillus faecis]GIO83484.1 hypothetical protein J25TS5_04160 [Paenibacillus faecis]
MSNFELEYNRFCSDVMRNENHSNILILANPRFAGEISKDENLSKNFILTLKDNGDGVSNRLFEHELIFSPDIEHYEFVNCGYDNDIEKALKPYAEKERKRIFGR